MLRVICVSFYLLLFAGRSVAQDSTDDLLAVGNGEIVAELTASESRLRRITGRLSFDAVISNNEVVVREFNLVFIDVPQKLLAGDAPIVDRQGVLAFMTVPEEVQHLRLEKNGSELHATGQLKMTGDAAFLIDLAQPMFDGAGDVFETPNLPAVVDVDIVIPHGVSATHDRTSATAILKSVVIGVKSELGSFKVSIVGRPPIAIELASLVLFERASRLCVQPVQLEKTVNERSGDGLKHGKEGADVEWAKADITFEFQKWKTIPADIFWQLKSHEAQALLKKVELDKCIEVFFPYEFKPKDLWGGGATWGPGQASAQIISSDGNERQGNNQTHLAHELGHVLRLLHPNHQATSDLKPGTRGTLMCPSGFYDDNPKKNSLENIRLAKNPLLVFYIRPRVPAYDCKDRNDCGNCR